MASVRLVMRKGRSFRKSFNTNISSSLELLVVCARDEGWIFVTLSNCPFIWWIPGAAPRSNPLPFIYHFSCKRKPFHIPSLPQENATTIALFSGCRFMPVMDGNIHCLNKKGQMVSFLSLLTKTTYKQWSWLAGLGNTAIQLTDSLKHLSLPGPHFSHSTFHLVTAIMIILQEFMRN